MSILNILTYENVGSITVVESSGRVTTIRPEQGAHEQLRALYEQWSTADSTTRDNIEAQILELIKNPDECMLQVDVEQDLFPDENINFAKNRDGHVRVYRNIGDHTIILPDNIAQEMIDLSEMINRSDLEWADLPDSIKGPVIFVYNLCENTSPDVRDTLFKLYAKGQIIPRGDGNLNVLNETSVAKTITNVDNTNNLAINPANITSVTHHMGKIKVTTAY